MLSRAVLSTALLLAAVGCAPKPQTTAGRADAAALASCRSSTDHSFNRQNRYLLSERDDIDLPFSNAGDSGITTRGLTQRLDYDDQLNSCLAASRAPATAALPSVSIQPRTSPSTPGSNSRVQPF